MITVSDNLLLPPFSPQCILNPAATVILLNVNRPCHCRPAPSTALEWPMCAGLSSSLATACHSTPVPCAPASGLFVLCQTCLCLRALALAVPSAQNTFPRSPMAPSLLLVTLQRSLPRLPTHLCPFLAFLYFPSLLYFFSVYVLVCFYFPHQNVSSVRGQELCFGHCCIPDAEKSAWHIGKARECLLNEGISLQHGQETAGEGRVPGLRSS